MPKRRKLHEISLENDIRYRGPLSYQGFQILGWLCITLMVVIFLLQANAKLDPASAESSSGTILILSYVCSLSLPFLLISNFSRILNASEGYKMQLIRNGGGALAIFLGTMLFFRRYVISLIGSFVTDPQDVAPLLAEWVRGSQENGFIAFNIFVDLFLCTLFMYFLNARPNRFFVGKKLILFRLFAILPVAAEVFSLVLKARAASGEITLPLWAFPLLPVKPPMTFVVFMILAIYIKRREWLFCKHGRTHEEYQAFLMTNRNSLHFSVFLSVILVVAALVDFIILFIMACRAAPSLDIFIATEDISPFMTVGTAMGFGRSIPLMFVAPLVLLFSYTRTPKFKVLSMLIPMIAIGLMVLLLFEGAYQALIGFAQQLNPTSFREIMRDLFDVIVEP